MEERSVHSSTSDINSEEAVKTEYLPYIPRKKRICLVGSASEDPALDAAAQQFSVPVLKSETGVEYIDDTTYCTYFVLKKFEGNEYDVLHKTAHRILGPTALLQLAEKKESLPSINRPMYTQAMFGQIVVFTGFRRKEELTKLVTLIHHMGGSIRKEMGEKITHLVANCCGGKKYRYADCFNIPIMSSSWVTALWDARDDISFYSSNKDVLNAHKLKLFFGARICFYGFPEEEKNHMCEVLVQQGGEPTDIIDPNCTHVVIDLGKNRYRITDSARTPLTYLKFPRENLHIDIAFARNSKSLPYSFAYYDPYTNTIPSPSKSIFLSRLLNIDNKRKNYRPEELKVIATRKNVSQDSAICMDNSNDLPSSSFESVTMTFDEISEEDVNDTQDTFSVVESLDDLSVTSDGIMEVDSVMEDSRVVRPTTSLISKLEYERKHIPFKNIRSCSTVTFTSAKKPRRYIRWKRSTSCNAISKTLAPSGSNESKLRFPLAKRTTYQPSASFDTADSTTTILSGSQKTRRSFSKALRQSSALFSKISEIVFPSTFKQYAPRRQQDDTASTCSRQKYTPLPSPLPVPAKVARLAADDDCRARVSKLQGECCLAKKRSFRRMQDKSFLVVVDESNVNSLPDIASQRARIVKAEWFWTSIQNEIAVDEDEYLFDKYLERLMSPSVSARRNSQPVNTPSSASKQRKRKRLPEVIEAAQNGTSSPASRNKRRSSLSEGFLSINSSLLDSTISPENQLLDDIPEVEVVDTETVRKTLSPRHQVFLELVQTESNYVGILSTIMTLFKEPLEDVDEKKEGLLNTTEAKIIFGNFPPIYEVHKKMLEELRFCATNWREDNSIGQIILKYSQDLLKAYPPYVNFFENTKEMLDQCDQNKPRFHAFLKVCQTKPECGRQSLKELMIKPVQRLPSISLLLNDILKHTDKKNSDHNALEQSLNSIKEVMTYINEDKRKTEGQLAMFDIFNEIDNCPPHLVSSHRSFIGKCDVQELSEGLSGRGDHLVLFLFTDTLEICKKRSKAFNSVKSPNTVNGLHTVKMSGKPYKHIKMLSLSTIKKVVDIRETDECRNVFALMVRSNQELREKLYSFTITDEEVNKTNYLRCLCRQIANTVCKADADTFLITLDSHQLEINTSDVALGTLSKAFKFATRTKKNIQRTFSFNKTPSKLKRAVSTMMSPFGSTTSLTPASHQLAQMRLASCNNINELGSNGSGTPSRGEMLVAPMSVQPTRKAKCSTLSMASLRRNGSDEAMQNKSDL